MTLTEIGILREYDFMKSHKYIRRELINGKWRYWYEEIKGRVSNGRFGRVLKEYVGNPRGAFKRLFRDKTGQAFDVVTLKLPAIDIDKEGKLHEVRQPNGEKLLIDTPIDLVWGDNRKGLKHILFDHFVTEKNFDSVQDAEDMISKKLKEFEINQESFEVSFKESESKFVLTSKDGKRFVIGIEQGIDSTGERTVRHFILTSFKMGYSKKTNTKEFLLRLNLINKGKSY